MSDRFKKIIKNNTQFFDVLVGYFRASGFYEIYEALENVEKIRRLVGINADEETVLVNNVAKIIEMENISTKIKTFTKKAIKEELENSEDTYEIDLSKKFIEYLPK